MSLPGKLPDYKPSGSSELEAILLVGFEGHVPSQEQINLLLSHPHYKNWVQDIRIITIGLPEPCPGTSEEGGRLACVGAVVHGTRILGHEIDLDKVTYRIVTFRKAGHVLVVELGK
ncbi:MAG: hypothetical protein OEZ07_04425 [Dehalococcoidia bacterium]|nr:hypothetical protein [Dehalococcoidia bacterium]